MREFLNCQTRKTSLKGSFLADYAQPEISLQFLLDSARNLHTYSHPVDSFTVHVTQV